MKNFKIPQEVRIVCEKLEAAGFEAFLVGGCVRDLLLDREIDQIKDWDVTTKAQPREVMEIFPFGKYENSFGTVMLPTKYLTQDQADFSGNIEVTTYRIESKYSDKRHPDEIQFAKTLDEDLSRRDFTINSLALRVGNKESGIRNQVEVIDLFGGQKDLEKKLIRAVADPNERFDEDALRMMRAIRFSVCLESQDKTSGPLLNPPLEKGRKHEKFQIEKNTLAAIKKNAQNLKYISRERIRDEFEKIILSPAPARGVRLLLETGLMQWIIPEFLPALGVRQNRHHYHGPFNTVDKHLLASLEKCPSEKLEVRLAALLHDIGKPQTKRGQGENATFHGHEYASARMTKAILERLRFPRKVIDRTVLLVRNHMFYYNVDEVGESGVRRVVRKVGRENIADLIDVRIADRLGSGVPKAVPYKLRHFQYMVEKVSTDPISVKQLKVDGHDLMTNLKIQPGPKIGAILEVLLAHAIEDPGLNTKKKLLEEARLLQDKNLSELRKLAKEKIEEKKAEEKKKMKGRYWVK